MTADPRVSIQSRLAVAGNYNRWIVDQANEVAGQRVLDAGAGAGNLTDFFLDRERIVAVDVWPEFASLLQAKYSERANVLVLQGDLADPATFEGLSDERLDTVVCANVLEHVQDDRQALRNFAAVLPQGGRVFLLVPAFMLLYGAHDRADNHYRRYTKRSLRRTVDGLPLRIDSLRYINLPGFFAWLLLVRLMGRELNEGPVRFYDRIIPFIARAERRVRPPFGQSLVATMTVID